MLHDIVLKGSVDRSVTVRIIDSADGTPETGVVYNTSGIDLWYRREGAAVTSITEATLAALTTAHADGGFLTVSHGYYRLDLPDAAFATGANYVDFGGTVTGMIVIGGRVRLVDFNPEAVLATPTNITAGTITTVTNLTNAPTSGDLTATMKTSVTTAVPTAAVVADAVWDEDATAHQTTGTFGQAIGDPVADTNTIYKAVVTDAAGATVGLDVVAVKSDTAATLVDTGTTLDAALATVDGIVDDIKQMIGHKTTIATLASQTSFTLTAGSADDNAYNGWGCFVVDASTATQVALGVVSDYTGATKTITLVADPAVFTMATTDIVILLPAKITDGVTLTAAGVDAILDEVVEGSVTLRQSVRLWNSAMGAKASGLATTTAVYRDLGDTKDRITGTVDASGNRTAVTLDLT